MATLHYVPQAHDPIPAPDLRAQQVACFTLENGLRVVVLPYPRTTAITHMIWYKNGAVDDPLGCSGLAHFLEHMMFKGTPHVDISAFQKRVTSSGGMMNAFTGWPFTSYFEQVTRDHLEECMAFEADRMHNMRFDPAAVEAERNVILAERGMVVESDPGSVLDEALFATSFASTPQARPVIGWRHEILAIEASNLAAYYKRFYRPENAVLIVAGGVETDDVEAIARGTYGAVPPQGLTPARVRARSAPSAVSRNITLASPAVRQAMLKKAFVVPACGSTDRPLELALELLALHLGGTKTSLLRQKLVIERQIATNIGTAYWADALLGETLFFVVGVPAGDVTVEALDQAIDETLGQVLRDGISDADLARARRQMLAQFTFTQDAPMELAHLYGRRLCHGLSLQEIAARPEQIAALTREDIVRAMQLLNPRTQVVAYLLPERAPTIDEGGEIASHDPGIGA